MDGFGRERTRRNPGIRANVSSIFHIVSDSFSFPLCSCRCIMLSESIVPAQSSRGISYLNSFFFLGAIPNSVV